MVKNGTRLRSQVCDGEVIVVKTAESLDDLRAGGVPMVPLDQPASATADAVSPDLATGCVLGKRYIAADGGEVLVTRAGVGTLTTGGTPLALKQASALPASD